MPDYTVNQAIITDSPPAENLLRDGDHIFYLDGENLVELIKANGVLFEDVVGADSSEPEEATGTGGIGNWTSLDTGLYAGNLQLLSGGAVLIATDNDGDPRAKFGQVASDSYGVQVLNEDGSLEIMGFYGATANIAGWDIGQNSIEKTITNGASKTLRLTTASSEPSLVVLIASLEKIRMGLLDSTETGLLVKASGGETLLQISGGSADVANIAGWHFSDTQLKSTASASTAHLKLDSSKMRVSIMDDASTAADKIAMGYLEGLVKNKSVGLRISAPSDEGGDDAEITVPSITTIEHENSFGANNALAGLKYYIADDTGGKYVSGTNTGYVVASNTFNTMILTDAYTDVNAAWSADVKYYYLEFQSDDYGFWAKDGDNLRIDGDVVYDSGDWLISSDGAVKFYSGGTEVMRLGTHSGNRGLFIGNGITDSTINARFTSGGFVIGDVDGSTNRIEWTGSALNIVGTFTVQDAVLPTLAKAEINKQWYASDSTTITSNVGEIVIYGYSGNGVADVNVEGAFMYQGLKYSIERWQGWTTNTGETRDGDAFTISTQAPPSGTLDSYIVYETAGGVNGQPTTAAGNAPFEMTGLTGDPFYRIALATRTTTVSSAGVISVVWKYDPNSTILATFTPTATMVVIGYCRTTNVDEIVYTQLFREAQPIDVVQDIAGWDTSNFNVDGTSAILNSPGVTITGGGITMSSGGSIKGGQSDYNTDTGFFLGYSGGDYKFSIGNTSTNSITWDGSAMSIRGSLNADDISAGTLSASFFNAKDIVSTGVNYIYTPQEATNTSDLTTNGWTTTSGTFTYLSASAGDRIRIINDGTDGNTQAWSNVIRVDPQLDYELVYDIAIQTTAGSANTVSTRVAPYMGIEGFVTTDGTGGCSDWTKIDKDGAVIGTGDDNVYFLAARLAYGDNSFFRYRHIIYGYGSDTDKMKQGGNIGVRTTDPGWSSTAYSSRNLLFEDLDIQSIRLRLLNYSESSTYGDGSSSNDVKVNFRNIAFRPIGAVSGRITADQIYTGTLQASETITVVDNSSNVRVKIGNLS